MIPLGVYCGDQVFVFVHVDKCKAIPIWREYCGPCDAFSWTLDLHQQRWVIIITSPKFCLQIYWYVLSLLLWVQRMPMAIVPISGNVVVLFLSTRIGLKGKEQAVRQVPPRQNRVDATWLWSEDPIFAWKIRVQDIETSVQVGERKIWRAKIIIIIWSLDIFETLWTWSGIGA